MTITAYRFGEIEVDGRKYTADLIAPSASWTGGGESRVMGTGHDGRMAIADETRRYLQEQRVELHEAPTAEAVQEFNRLQRESARIVAALHLTC